MKIQIINGPNLNLLGVREKSIYGDASFETYLETLRQRYANITIDYYQSNIEGEIINKLHEVGFSYDGIVMNAGAYTHTSIAIADAIAAINTPVIEVHISNVHRREAFRHHSYVSAVAEAVICGCGTEGYVFALQRLSTLFAQGAAR